MKSLSLAVLSAVAFQQVAAHSIFQQLWVDGVDQGSSCNRMPMSNSPVTSVSGSDIRCNTGTKPVALKCAAKAGGQVTVEMHAQPGDRSCANEAIGGAHYGPVIVYMSKVGDSSTADGSAGWFKIFENGWSKVAGSSRGDDDNWGVKDLNKNCGKMTVKIPSDIAPGDYLLRAEVIALHSAGGSGGAQFYMSCYQLTVSGTGNASPPTVSFPGAYKASDPGILVNIHGSMSNYIVPGPSVYGGGGAPLPTSTGGSNPPPSSTTFVVVPTSTKPADCAVSKWGQCGGVSFTGCTSCASGSTCVAVSPPHYYQCQ